MDAAVFASVRLVVRRLFFLLIFPPSQSDLLTTVTHTPAASLVVPVSSLIREQEHTYTQISKLKRQEEEEAHRKIRLPGRGKELYVRKEESATGNHASPSKHLTGSLCIESSLSVSPLCLL